MIWILERYLSAAVVTGRRVVSRNATVKEACATYMVPVTTGATGASVKPHANIVLCGRRPRFGQFGQSVHFLNYRGQYRVQEFAGREDLDVVGGGGRSRHEWKELEEVE
jgi:hypothetical protein